MVLPRAGNWEMKNIFYYLTNHLNNFQWFCSQFRGAQTAMPSCHRGCFVGQAGDTEAASARGSELQAGAARLAGSTHGLTPSSAGMEVQCSHTHALETEARTRMGCRGLWGAGRDRSAVPAPMTLPAGAARVPRRCFRAHERLQP